MKVEPEPMTGKAKIARRPKINKMWCMCMWKLDVAFINFTALSGRWCACVAAHVCVSGSERVCARILGEYAPECQSKGRIHEWKWIMCSDQQVKVKVVSIDQCRTTFLSAPVCLPFSPSFCSLLRVLLNLLLASTDGHSRERNRRDKEISQRFAFEWRAEGPEEWKSKSESLTSGKQILILLF